MSLVNTTDATEADLEVLRDQLGRVPRGVVGIAARCVCGRPTVVATAPRLPDGTPFPTTYYLTHPAAVKGASTLEAEHVMETLNEELAADEQECATIAETGRGGEHTPDAESPPDTAQAADAQTDPKPTPTPADAQAATARAASRNSSWRSEGSSTSWEKSTARAVAKGRLAHHRCSVEGCPLRMDFSRADCWLMASRGSATSMSFLGTGVLPVDGERGNSPRV